MEQRASRPCRKVIRGFTLIELMVTVAVMAVIASIAFPNYMEYVRRSRITEATGALATTRVKLEQYYQDNKNYGSTASACGIAMPSAKYFTFSCNWGAGGTSQSFLMTATGKASDGMGGYTFTVDHNNTQRTTAFPNAAGLPVNCWLKRKGDTC